MLEAAGLLLMELNTASWDFFSCSSWRILKNSITVSTNVVYFFQFHFILFVQLVFFFPKIPHPHPPNINLIFKMLLYELLFQQVHFVISM